MSTGLPRARRAARAAVAALALFALAAPASALAGASGGIGTGGPGGVASGGAQGGGAAPSPAAPGSGSGANASPGECEAVQLGSRALRLGDCGKDVATLNWILRASEYAAPFAKQFAPETETSVRAFQRAEKIGANGIADSATIAALVGAMPVQLATWYGPGFFGNTTACGQTLTRRTKGVAHKTLPCGSRVVVGYGNRFVRTRVIDRGPYANGAHWDLTQATARQLGFEHTDDIRVAKIPKPVTLD